MGRRHFGPSGGPPYPHHWQSAPRQNDRYVPYDCYRDRHRRFSPPRETRQCFYSGSHYKGSACRNPALTPVRKDSYHSPGKKSLLPNPPRKDLTDIASRKGSTHTSSASKDSSTSPATDSALTSPNKNSISSFERKDQSSKSSDDKKRIQTDIQSEIITTDEKSILVTRCSRKRRELKEYQRRLTALEDSISRLGRSIVQDDIATASKVEELEERISIMKKELVGRQEKRRNELLMKFKKKTEVEHQLLKLEGALELLEEDEISNLQTPPLSPIALSECEKSEMIKNEEEQINQSSCEGGTLDIVRGSPASEGPHSYSKHSTQKVENCTEAATQKVRASTGKNENSRQESENSTKKNDESSEINQDPTEKNQNSTDNNKDCAENPHSTEAIHSAQKNENAIAEVAKSVPEDADFGTKDTDHNSTDNNKDCTETPYPTEAMHSAQKNKDAIAKVARSVPEDEDFGAKDTDHNSTDDNKDCTENAYPTEAIHSTQKKEATIAELARSVPEDADFGTKHTDQNSTDNKDCAENPYPTEAIHSTHKNENAIAEIARSVPEDADFGTKDKEKSLQPSINSVQVPNNPVHNRIQSKNTKTTEDDNSLSSQILKTKKAKPSSGEVPNNEEGTRATSSVNTDNSGKSMPHCLKDRKMVEESKPTSPQISVEEEILKTIFPMVPEDSKKSNPSSLELANYAAEKLKSLLKIPGSEDKSSHVLKGTEKEDILRAYLEKTKPSQVASERLVAPSSQIPKNAEKTNTSLENMTETCSSFSNVQTVQKVESPSELPIVNPATRNEGSEAGSVLEAKETVLNRKRRASLPIDTVGQRSNEEKKRRHTDSRSENVNLQCLKRRPTETNFSYCHQFENLKILVRENCSVDNLKSFLGKMTMDVFIRCLVLTIVDRGCRFKPYAASVFERLFFGCLSFLKKNPEQFFKYASMNFSAAIVERLTRFLLTKVEPDISAVIVDKLNIFCQQYSYKISTAEEIPLEPQIKCAIKALENQYLLELKDVRKKTKFSQLKDFRKKTEFSQLLKPNPCKGGESGSEGKVTSNVPTAVTPGMSVPPNQPLLQPSSLATIPATTSAGCEVNLPSCSSESDVRRENEALSFTTEEAVRLKSEEIRTVLIKGVAGAHGFRFLQLLDVLKQDFPRLDLEEKILRLNNLIACVNRAAVEVYEAEQRSVGKTTASSPHAPETSPSEAKQSHGNNSRDKYYPAKNPPNSAKCAIDQTQLPIKADSLRNVSQTKNLRTPTSTVPDGNVATNVTNLNTDVTITASKKITDVLNRNSENSMAILVQQPTTSPLNSEVMNGPCGNCGKITESWCDCGLQPYCSEACQMADWENKHEIVCTAVLPAPET